MDNSQTERIPQNEGFDTKLVGVLAGLPTNVEGAANTKDVLDRCDITEGAGTLALLRLRLETRDIPVTKEVLTKEVVNELTQEAMLFARTRNGPNFSMDSEHMADVVARLGSALNMLDSVK